VLRLELEAPQTGEVTAWMLLWYFVGSSGRRSGYAASGKTANRQKPDFSWLKGGPVGIGQLTRSELSCWFMLVVS
jgi:hypothetical protein